MNKQLKLVGVAFFFFLKKNKKQIESKRSNTVQEKLHIVVVEDTFEQTAEAGEWLTETEKTE